MTTKPSIAVDIGGTFTDIVLFNGDQVFVDKTLTTPDDLLTGFFRGVDAVLAKAKLNPADVDGAIVHATTIVTNALIERTGGRTAMIFTEGFSNILHIRDCRRYDMYDLQIEFPKPLVSPEYVYTIRERIAAEGDIITPLGEPDIEALCSKLRDDNINSVGICLLNAYKNGAHEKQLTEAIRKRLPNLFISASHEVAPQIREYWRASTTSVNAYAMPITQPYLTRLSNRLTKEGFPSNPLIMLSSGGLVGSSTAGRIPVRMIESGPAAGALGAAAAARILNLDNVIAFDMGGTTAKACVVQDCRPLVTGFFEIDRMYRMKEGSGLPVIVPSIDLIEIGAGGGSIASIDSLGLLKVGPRSAGSRPGPACYGQGGKDATVTDADVVLGLIDAKNFLGGAMPLDVGAAETAIKNVAERLGVTTIEAARGIFRVVCENMAGAVRTHAADRGVDHRGVPLLAFGGAGPVHACAVAELLNSSTVIFPPLASVYSAFGSLVTPPKLPLVRTGLSRLDELDWRAVGELLTEMEKEGLAALKDAGMVEQQIRFEYAVDMRYLGQQFEIMIELGGRPEGAAGAIDARRRFEEEYLKRYRLVQSEVPVEVVNWRITAVAPAHLSPTLSKPTDTGKSGRTRKLDAWGKTIDVPVISRAGLAGKPNFLGPLIIEEADTTLVIPPRWKAELVDNGSVIATRVDLN